MQVSNVYCLDDLFDCIDEEQEVDDEDFKKKSKSRVLRVHRHMRKCPRCRWQVQKLYGAPHCNYCNWDYLTDPSRITLTLYKKD